MGIRGKAKTPRERCRNGLHAFTPENTMWVDVKTNDKVYKVRRCRTCRNRYFKQWYANRRQAQRIILASLKEALG